LPPGVLAALLLAGCASEQASPTAASSSAVNLEQECIDAATIYLSVRMSQVRVVSRSTDTNGLTTMQLDVNGNGATCFVDATGYVSDVDYGGGTKL